MGRVRPESALLALACPLIPVTCASFLGLLIAWVDGSFSAFSGSCLRLPLTVAEAHGPACAHTSIPPVELAH